MLAQLIGAAVLGISMGFFISHKLSEPERMIVVIVASIAYGTTGMLWGAF